MGVAEHEDVETLKMQLSGKTATKRETVPAPPDGGYGWVVLVACFLISFIIDGCMYSIGLVLPDVKAHFGVSQEQVNLLNSLNTGFLFCSGPIVAGLTNQLGVRIVVMGGAVITALCYVASAYAPSIYIIMVAYGVIGGITTGCTYIASLIIVAQYFDRLQGVATGVTMAGSGVGAFVFAKFSKVLVDFFDWKYALIISGAIIIECSLLGALLRPVPTKPKPITRQDTTAEVHTFTGSVLSLTGVGTDSDSGCLNMTVKILKEMSNLSLLKENVAFLFITISNFFIFAGYFIPFLYVPIRAIEIKIKDASFILGLIGLINIPARLGFGFLADARYIAPINLNTICTVIATAALWTYSLMTTYALQLCFSVVFALGIAGINCITTPYLKDIVGMDKFSNAMGIINLFRGFGCFIGPFFGGFISDKFQSTVAAFYYSAICFSVGLVFAVLVSFGSKLGIFKTPKYQVTNKNQI